VQYLHAWVTYDPFNAESWAGYGTHWASLSNRHYDDDDIVDLDGTHQKMVRAPEPRSCALGLRMTCGGRERTERGVGPRHDLVAGVFVMTSALHAVTCRPMRARASRRPMLWTTREAAPYSFSSALVSMPTFKAALPK
jgi:hypothetical protein